MSDSQNIERLELGQKTGAAKGGNIRDMSFFNDWLLDEIARAKRYKYNFSILFVEMDNFDAYALKYGKDAGRDQVSSLRAVLSDSLRNTDIICHFAESKYGVILPYCTSMQARIVAERIRGHIARTFIPESLSSDIGLTSSIGFVAYPEDALSRELLVTGGTYALSMAKSNGGNCTCHISEPPGQPGYAGAANRPKDVPFMEFLGNEIARCSRYGHHLSVAILAIRRAGGIVKELENDVSPELGQAVNRRLNEALRATDRCFPYATNKWAMVLANTGQEGAQICAQKLFRSLNAGGLLKLDGQDVGVSSTIGIATFPEDDSSKENLVQLAEGALDQACKSGINRFRMTSTLPELPGTSDGDVRKWIAHLKGAKTGAAYVILSAVDAVGNCPGPHSHSVARYAVALGQVLGLPGDHVRQLRTVGQMHDIGKRCIPASLITKPAALDVAEWEIMHRHAQYGAAILEQFTDLAVLAPGVLAHHERWDGRGYPRGLKGDQIPLEARIISVAEAFDDMTTRRPYKKAMTVQQAMEEISGNSGTQFDPAIAKGFIAAISSLKEI
jgi:diguanylate cyclase (GGDEF)-like protein